MSIQTKIAYQEAIKYAEECIDDPNGAIDELWSLLVAYEKVNYNSIDGTLRHGLRSRHDN